MRVEEKTALLGLLNDSSRWCQHSEALDSSGNPVHCDSEDAVAWDMTGAIYRLFGASRAGALFTQLDRHIHGKQRIFGWPQPDAEIGAMLALQAFNDREDTTFERMRGRLESAPVWSSVRPLGAAASAETES